MTNFNELPAEQRAKVQKVGSLGITRDYYDEVEYRGDGYAIHVAGFVQEKRTAGVWTASSWPS